MLCPNNLRFINIDKGISCCPSAKTEAQNLFIDFIFNASLLFTSTSGFCKSKQYYLLTLTFVQIYASFTFL
ncbi:hypothetical protein C7N43_20755 [Sphingobacteriales bacterium UPWRP_1]|nr:hypothetical protein B6N25_01660 [Sphingobacteriales bacterium TSM_CSS]PSJ75074.1 hypothetical protein C7N43_20755 [Sphingobacteriales bacterium UPWRP_1]